MIAKVGNTVVKSRTIPVVQKTVLSSKAYRKSDNVLVTSYGGGIITTDTGLEKIAYTTKQKANRQKSNSCNHLRTRTQYMGDVTNSVRSTETVGAHYWINYVQHTECALRHPQAVTTAQAALGMTLGPAYVQSNGQALINAAHAALKPDLTDLSVPNFLVELGDISKLFSLWRKSLSLAKNLAGAHLNYAFGWKPTIGDIKTALFGVKSLQERLAAFQRSLNVLSHKQKTMLEETSTKSGAYTPVANCQVNWSISVTRKCTAHIAFRPLPMRVMGNLERVLRYHLDRLGFELNPRIVWDALPFTFVVDWFLNVGSALEHLKVDTLELPIMLVDSYLQYTEEIRVESYVSFNVNNVNQQPIFRSGGTVTNSKLFLRVPLAPDYSLLSEIGWRMPSHNQAILLVSLATVLKR